MRASSSRRRAASFCATDSRCSASRRPSACERDRARARAPRTLTHPPMTVLVVGSIALDSVETPFGKAENVIGGSATFFAAAASLLTPVQVVGIVGSDYPVEKLERLR